MGSNVEDRTALTPKRTIIGRIIVIEKDWTTDSTIMNIHPIGIRLIITIIRVNITSHCICNIHVCMCVCMFIDGNAGYRYNEPLYFEPRRGDGGVRVYYEWY